MVEHFRKHAKSLCADELDNDSNNQMLNYTCHLSNQIDENFFEHQIKLTASDQEMCRYVTRLFYEY